MTHSELPPEERGQHWRSEDDGDWEDAEEHIAQEAMDGTGRNKIEADFQDDKNVSEIQNTLKEVERGTQALRNLCLVSRSLQKLATIHLFAFFNGRTDKAVFFLRTLVERPEYAAYVRGLAIEPFGKVYTWRSFEKDSESDRVSFALVSILHKVGMATKRFPKHFSSLLSLLDESSEQEIIAQWLILHLPNLAILRISIPEEWSFELLKYVAEFDRSILPQLRILNVLGPPAWQIFYAEPPVVRLEPISELLNLPHLEDVWLDYCVHFEGSSELLSHVRRISHWSCGATKCQIAKLVSGCRALEDYELEYGGGKGLDVSYLSSSKHTLQYLTLDVHDFVPNVLTEYSRLKTVTFIIGTIDMCRPGSAPTTSHATSRRNPPPLVLARILPASVEHIHLEEVSGDIDKAANVWQSQITYCLANEKRKFKSLKSIQIPWRPDEKLHDLCVESNIELLVR